MSLKEKVQQAGKTLAKNSPTIFTGLGIVGLGATAYFAYKSRDGVEDIVDAIEETREAGEEVNRMEVARDLLGVMALPVATGLLSGACIITAHRIQNQRIGTLSTALLAQQAKNLYFEKKYKEQNGEEEYNRFMMPVEEEEVTNEAGEKTTVDVRQDPNSLIGAWFDKSKEYASDDHTYNLSYIESSNDKLQTRLFQKGHLLLNEVLDELGLDRIPSGQLMGWSTADLFQLDKTVLNERDEEGNIIPQIWVTWPDAHYIYNDIDFTGRYSPYSN